MANFKISIWLFSLSVFFHFLYDNVIAIRCIIKIKKNLQEVTIVISNFFAWSTQVSSTISLLYQV